MALSLTSVLSATSFSPNDRYVWATHAICPYLIFGKESTGIPKDILKDNLDSCMRIPMTDNVRALNVSNSVAIAIYEVLRQQNYNNLLKYEPHKGADWLERE